MWVFHVNGPNQFGAKSIGIGLKSHVKGTDRVLSCRTKRIVTVTPFSQILTRVDSNCNLHENTPDLG